ncbi:transposable element Tcb1 transposase, partial [Trichonephila clavipes]
RRMRVAEWNKVVFTDDSRICLQHHDGRIPVWRHRGERMLNSCAMHRQTGPTPPHWFCTATLVLPRYTGSAPIHWFCPSTLVLHRHTGPAPGIIVWSGIRYHLAPPLVRIVGTTSSTSPRCWSQLFFLFFRAWLQPYFNRVMRDHTWHVLCKGSSSITRLNCFPCRLVLRIFCR